MRNRLILVAVLLAAAPAAAHVAIPEGSAAAGSSMVVHFRVGHGCSGAATTALRVTVPPGVTGARPQAKVGWTVQIERQGGQVSAITWSGGLLDGDQFDDFAVLMKLPATAGTLLFPALQTCTTDSEEWTAPPGDHVKNPAPVLQLTAPDPHAMMPGMDMGGMHHGM
jgi:uncharacterized protein YcnI